MPPFPEIGTSCCNYSIARQNLHTKPLCRVCSKGTHFAKHTGAFIGMPPIDKEAVVNGVEVIRLANGKIVEFWRHADDAGLLMQLGALPAPA